MRGRVVHAEGRALDDDQRADLRGDADAADDVPDALDLVVERRAARRRDGDQLAVGQRLTIEVPIAPGRRFRPKVVELVPGERMVWRDGFFPMFQGTRTFTLTPGGAGTRFAMAEVFRGLMLPLARRALPDFGPVFDRYAADLKAACEVPDR